MTDKNKKDVKAGILGAISKLFGILRGLIEVVFSLIKNAMALLVFFFRFLVQTIAHPTMPSVIAIIFFLGSVGISVFQWVGIGRWLFTLFGVSTASFFGYQIAGGFFGLLLGFGINVYQMSPELWKLTPQVAKAYVGLSIDPEAELEKPTLQNKLSQWLTYDHGTLKGLRLVSYTIETVLTLCYTVFASGLSFSSVMISAASLLLPEFTLKGVAAATGVTSAVSQKMQEEEAKNTEERRFKGEF